MTVPSLLRRNRPSRAVSLTVSAVLVAIWGTLRLVVFSTVIFPLAYVLPLLVCVWTRDRLALLGMAGIFSVFHTLKVFWILPEGALGPDAVWAFYTATLVNIAVATAVILGIIVLRERLEASHLEISRQAEELRAQGEELASQNEQLTEQAEELTRQTEEVAAQAEELASQNQELQAQSEEIGALNEELTRREALLQTLLESTRRADSEPDTLQHIAAAALDLVGEGRGVAAVYERTPSGLVRRALAVSGAPELVPDAAALPPNAFVDLVLHENRTAALDDAAARPDLGLPTLPGHAPFHAVLATPLREGDRPVGALALYLHDRHVWTDQQFRLVEWLADQCAQVLAVLRIQAELREADRRKGEFLATLSHELRNPLAPIRYAVELLSSDAAARGTDPRRILDRQLRHLVRLVDDLLDATRISSNKVRLQKARVELAPIVQQAVEAVVPDIETAGHALTIDLPSQPIWLDADADRLTQVVINLLSNAARYTPPGGRVTVRAVVAGPDVELAVIDNGVGLEPQHLTTVFDMFTQVGDGPGGLGIGLSLVKGIVELHGGRVAADSDGPGRGSVFRVTLPTVPAPITAGATGRVPMAAARKRVLVVDDNVDSAEMMATLLEMHGHDVRMAHEGEAALAAAREFEPEVGLLDIGLPGLDGYELASRLRQDAGPRRLHLIAVTGWGHDEDRQRARLAGFDAHLTKPAAPERILEFVARAGHGDDIGVA
jgi:signal transduction histidine kinase/ActR/RegA family two-component response regulator